MAYVFIFFRHYSEKVSYMYIMHIILAAKMCILSIVELLIIFYNVLHKKSKSSKEGNFLGTFLRLQKKGDLL